MLIKIINPNTTQYMTKDIYRSAIRCANPGTEIIAVNPQRGPVSIENFCDEYVAAIGVMEEVHKGADQGIDAYIIACFDDPGLYAAREITDVPVVGIAEAAMHLATMVASKFSIITVIPRTRLMLEELVKKYGLEKKCASIRASGMQVLDFERDPIKGKQRLKEESRRAIIEDGAEAICLGCAGMTNFAQELEQELQVPVFDAVASAVKICEALVGMNKKTCKKMYFSYPEKKLYKGYPDIMQP